MKTVETAYTVDFQNPIFDFIFENHASATVNERKDKVFWYKFSRWIQIWTQKSLFRR